MLSAACSNCAKGSLEFCLGFRSPPNLGYCKINAVNSINQNFPNDFFCLEMGEFTGFLHLYCKYTVVHNTNVYSLNKAVYPLFRSRDMDRDSLAS